MSRSLRSRARDRWRQMIRRCTDPSSPDWPNYGSRGITVCDRWLDFDTYYADVGPCPEPGLTLDRVDNDGNYEPGNWRWATRAEQTANRRLLGNQTSTVTACIHGHPFDEANTYRWGNRRF